MSGSTLVEQLKDLGVDHGLNLFGLVSAEEFDGCQPAWCRATDQLSGCGTVAVFGSGGTALWQSVQDSQRIGSPCHLNHPIRQHCVRWSRETLGLLQNSGLDCAVVFPHEKYGCGTQKLNFLQLGEMAGFGSISPVVGLLLHPQYGPWTSVQAAILIPGRPFDLPERSKSTFQPCLRCNRPCLKACPASVYDGHGNVDLESCADSRTKGPCISHCEVRRACPVGAEYRYEPKQESFRHKHLTLSMQRQMGMGWWKLVPRVWR